MITKQKIFHSEKVSKKTTGNILTGEQHLGASKIQKLLKMLRKSLALNA